MINKLFDTETIKNNQTNNQFVFFLGLYFLIFICYVNSYYYSLHFLFTFEVSYAGSFFFKFLFLLFVVLYLLNPNSGMIIFSALTNLSLLALVSNLGLKLNNFTRNYPILSFYLGYIYVLLFVLHWFMLLFTELDLGVEFFYNCFNLIRLLLFPLVIAAYIATYGPRLHVVEIHLTLDDCKNIVKDIYSFASKAYAKAPLPVKVGTGVLTAAAAFQGGAMLHASTVRARVYQTTKAPIIDTQFQALNSHACLQDEKCQQLVQDTIRYFAKLNGSTVSITIDDIKSKLKDEPTYLEQLHEFLDVLPKINQKAYLNMLEKEAAHLGQSSSSTYQSTTPISENKSSQLEQAKLTPGSPPETNINIVSDKTITPLAKSPGAHSPLEELWSIFS